MTVFAPLIAMYITLTDEKPLPYETVTVTADSGLVATPQYSAPLRLPMAPDARRVFQEPIPPLIEVAQLDAHEFEKIKTTTTSLALCVVSLKVHAAPEQVPPSVPCVSTDSPATFVTVVVDDIVVMLVVRLVPEIVVVDDVVLVVVEVTVVILVVELVVEYVYARVFVTLVV